MPKYLLVMNQNILKARFLLLIHISKGFWARLKSPTLKVICQKTKLYQMHTIHFMPIKIRNCAKGLSNDLAHYRIRGETTYRNGSADTILRAEPPASKQGNIVKLCQLRIFKRYLQLE